MADLTRLNTVIEESGVKLVAIADRLDISRQALYSKLKGETEFSVDQVGTLAKFLHLSMEDVFEIFLS